MYTPSGMSHDLIRVNEAQAVRATRFTWQRAATQRRPGRWVANWFRRHLPDIRRRERSVPADGFATSGQRGGVSPMTVEPHVRADVLPRGD